MKVLLYFPHKNCLLIAQPLTLIDALLFLELFQSTILELVSADPTDCAIASGHRAKSFLLNVDAKRVVVSLYMY